ncbi:MAG: serine/threonine-protein kinase [Melioribacteraceae bacterium]
MDSMIGKTIDNYKIQSVLGKGGMGTVYKAVDTTLEKTVALKMIDPVLARDEDFLRRFKTEAKALARLENPNIVSIYTFRETDEGIFIVMEFVDGQTLTERIREKGVLPLDGAISVSRQLLNAIGHAHKVGILHRDIKASNILLTDDGKVKVTDFGLAKVLQSHGRDSTVTQMRAGTLYYMSPEQVKGLKNVDKRSDIYSIGMTIYEMFAGKVPFDKTDSDFTIQKQIVDGEIPSPVKLNSNLPKQLGKIIQKAISNDPNKRYQSADEMLKAFNEYEEKKTKGKRTKSIEIKPIYKQPIFLALISAVIVLLILLFTGILNNLTDNSNRDEHLKIPIITKISVSTIPEYATVFINGDSIGISPINNFSVTESNLVLNIKRIGFSTIDTTIAVKKGKLNNVTFILQSLPSLLSAGAAEVISENSKEIYGGLNISSRPSGASITLNGIFKGTTPHKYDELKPGKYNLKISKKNYADYSKRIVVQENKVKTISPRLELIVAQIEEQQIEEEIKQEQTSAIGTINIFPLPFGSIYIDDELKVEGTNKPYGLELSTGSYILKVTHPTFGKWEKRIAIERDKFYDFKINFNKQFRLTVTSNQKLCQIYVDGKSIGKVTPKVIKLRAGLHTITVKKDGYQLLREEYKINIESDATTPIHFELREK